MPIHLPPISRRQFLIRSFVAGAGLALAPEIYAASKKVDADFWALLSDPHIAASRSEIVRAVNMTEHFTTVTDEILALPQRPAGVFVNGDCACSTGEKSDYATFADLLKPVRRVGMKVHLTLGNHDHRENFWSALKAEKSARRPLADRQAALLRMPRVNWFLLDSLEKTLATPGLLGGAQLDWLAKTLDANAGKPAIVLVHHNLDVSEKTSGLKDTNELLKILRPRTHVKTCFYGHTHDWNVKQDESGIHLVNLPPTSYVFKEGRPSGWVRANLEAEGMRLELRCVNPQHKEHGQVVNLKWRPA